MSNWIKNTFDTFEDENEEYFKFNYNGYTVISPIESFVEIFGDEKLSCDELKAIDGENKRGWHQYFDDWKQKGILN